jgi:transposase-like protein
MTTPARSRYAGHRFPPEVIGHVVWLYFRFPLSLRMVEYGFREIMGRRPRSRSRASGCAPAGR